MDLLIRLIIGLLFFLFSYGVYTFAVKFSFFLQRKFCQDNKVYFSKSLIYIFLLTVYCILCNGILLVLPIFEYTKLFNSEFLYHLKFFIELFLIAIVLCIAFSGLYFLSFQKNKDKFRIKNVFFILRENKPERLNNILNYIFLISPILFYILFFPPSLLNLIGDTGSYHLPYVNHIAYFGIEKGLVYFNNKFTFYYLTAYGQTPFQIILKYLTLSIPNISEKMISPSLNILYFSGFLIYIKENFIENRFSYDKSNKKHNSNKNKISNEKNIARTNNFNLIIYNFLIFSFIPLIGFNSKFSLLSYNVDLIVAILTLILTHSITKSFMLDKYDLAFYSLIFLLPVFKLSAVISLLYIGICYLFFIIYLKKNIISFTFLFKKLTNNIKKYIFYYIFLIFITYAFFLITNIIQTGYLFFPSTLLGPIGEHALSINKAQEYKEYLIAWSRFINFPELIDSNANYSDWIPIFLKSKIGLFMMVVLIFSTYSILVNSLKPNKFYSSINLIYSSSLFTTLITIILFFPTDLRFFSWIIAIFFYLLAIKYFQNLLTLFNNSLSLIFAILITFYFSGTFLILVGFRMPNIKNTDMGTSQYEIKYASSDKWSHRNKKFDDDKIEIKIPKYQGACWNIKPPCTVKNSTYLIFE